MTEPIVFISRNRIKEGMAEAFRQHYHTSLPVTEAAKPNTLVQLAYENDDSTELTIVRVFPTPEAMDQQLQGADDRSRRVYEFIEPTGIEVYGAPSAYTLQMIERVAGSGIAVSIHPHYAGGFIRPAAG